MITSWSRVLTRLGVAVALVAGAGLAVAPSASADYTTGNGASCSGSSCTVTVRFSGTAAPPAGSPQASASVPPDCWYVRYASPQEFLKQYRDGTGHGHYSGIEAYRSWGTVAEIEAAAEDPSKADWSWYMMRCRDGINALTDPIAQDYGRDVAGVNGGPITVVSLLLAPGQAPPPPPVDVETLRDAAREAMTIPDPTIDHSPSIKNQGGATLVNLPTWFSAGGGYADTFDITASVGPVSATVVAADPRWRLTSPGGSTSCSQVQMTVPLGSSTANPCSLSFLRPSAGMQIDATSTWQTSWSGTPQPAGPIALDTISATSQLVVPVVQNQVNVTEVD